MNSGGAASIWRRFCNVGGITTELLGVNATSGRPRLQVVLFPGNPGSAAYFKPFMLSVHQQLGGDADVVAVTHAGHDPETNHDGRVWDLSQQVSHKVSFLREHVMLPGRAPVLLVGHSIGAAMMVKAVAELEGLCVRQQLREHKDQERVGEQVANPLSSALQAAAAAAGSVPPILKLVAVFPFFETNFAGNTRQRLLRSLALRHELMGWVGAAVSSLPMALRLAFVRLNAAMDQDAVALTVGLLSRNTVRNAFFLAAHEFEDLSQPWDWSLLRSLGGRLHVMGCEEDTWMSRGQYDDMLQQVPGLQATWHPDLRHAFCVSKPQSDAVAEVIAGFAQSISELGPCPPWGSLPGSVSAVSVGRAAGSSASSSSSASGACSPTAFETTCQQQRKLQNRQLAEHQQPPHDDQQVPYGETSQQRRHLYGDDVITSSHRHEAAATAAATAAVAPSAEPGDVGGGGNVGGDADGDVDGSADQSAAAAGLRHRRRGLSDQQGAAVAVEYGKLALAAAAAGGSGAAAAVASSIPTVATGGSAGVTVRGLVARR